MTQAKYLGRAHVALASGLCAKIPVRLESRDGLQVDIDSKMKSSHGTFAAIVWIVAGALLYNTEPEAKLFSWQTPVFFVLGMFVAAAVLGSLSYAGVRGLTYALVSTRIVTAPTRRAEIGLTVAGYVIFAAQVALIYLVAKWTIRVMFQADGPF
jgi:hypothetical protein